MPDEVREHLTRDQRPFLHPESLQILHIHSSMTVLLFSSPHSLRPIFVLFLRFVFGLLSGWKIQTWPVIRFLTESVPCWFYLLVFDRIHDAMCLNKMSRTSSRNMGPEHQKYSSIFHCTHGIFFYPCVHQTHLECLLLKSYFFSFIWP